LAPAWWRAWRIAPALESLESRADALYACTDALLGVERVRLITVALGICSPHHGHPREGTKKPGQPMMRGSFRPQGTNADGIARFAAISAFSQQLTYTCRGHEPLPLLLSFSHGGQRGEG